jgi:uncharacterized protein (TIGR02266 family)
VKSREMVKRNRRLPIQLLIELDSKQLKGSYFIENLAMGGLFVESEKVLDIGSQVGINFTLPHNRQNFQLKAVVRWNRLKKGEDRPGMGIEFLSMTIEEEESILKAIEQYEVYIERNS